MDSEKRIALLIDGDCGLHKNFDEIFTKVSKHGKCYIKRVYGDFTKPTVKPWVQVARENSIRLETVINYTTGKNSTDAALIVDAMELLFTNKFDILCLVAGDSDYIRLIQRIQDEGKDVFGYGLKSISQKYLVSACDKFEYINDNKEEEVEKETKLSEKTDYELFIMSYENSSNDEGFSNISNMKKYITRVRPEYEHKGTFSSVLKRSGLFSIDKNRQNTILDEKAFLLWVYNQFDSKKRLGLGAYKKRILKYYKSYEHDETSFLKHIESIGIFNIKNNHIISIK